MNQEKDELYSYLVFPRFKGHYQYELRISMNNIPNQHFILTMDEKLNNYQHY